MPPGGAVAVAISGRSPLALHLTGAGREHPEGAHVRHQSVASIRMLPREDLRGARQQVRGLVPKLEEDRVLAPDIERLAKGIRNGDFDSWSA